MSQFKKYARYYEAFNQRKPYEREVTFVYRWLENPTSLLDVGCGTAHYWRYFPIVPNGVEKSKEMIELSSHRDLIVQADLLKLPKFDRTYDAVTAMFDVVNYIPSLRWWRNLPLKVGGLFVFDVWNVNKIVEQGFKITVRTVGTSKRLIIPQYYGGHVKFHLFVKDGLTTVHEVHRMYLYKHNDLVHACGTMYEIVDVQTTERWQTWYKLRRIR